MKQPVEGTAVCPWAETITNIALAFKNLLMPLLQAWAAKPKRYRPAIRAWWNAVAINDVPAQKRFYGSANGVLLSDLVRNARETSALRSGLASAAATAWYAARKRLNRPFRRADVAAKALPFISDDPGGRYQPAGLGAGSAPLVA